MYTKISDYVTCYNPYCIAIHIAYDTGTGSILGHDTGVVCNMDCYAIWIITCDII